MDNFQINVLACGKKNLQRGLEIAFSGGDWDPSKPIASHWAIDPEKGFVLLWGHPGGYSPEDKQKLIHPFYTNLDAVSATEAIWAWLQNLGSEEYTGKAQDAGWSDEVGNKKAWRVYTDGVWGHVEGYFSYAICAVKPEWAWIGK